MILNEIFYEAKKEGNIEAVFKVDFAKAYDSVCWEFLIEMMIGMNFSLKWRLWIMECVSMVTASMLVNGIPMGQFKLERGLRQGDALPPFLFLIVAEGRTIMVNRAIQCNYLEAVEV